MENKRKIKWIVSPENGNTIHRKNLKKASKNNDNCKKSALRIDFSNVEKTRFYIPIYDNTQFILQSQFCGVKVLKIVYVKNFKIFCENHALTQVCQYNRT